MRTLRLYVNEAQRVYRSGLSVKLTHLVRFWPAWSADTGQNFDPLASELPWLTFAAIDFLEKWLDWTTRVFEWGSGSSTLFFARRAQSVVSVEHSPQWAERVRERLALQRLGNVTLHLKQPKPSSRKDADPGEPAHYVSSSAEYAGLAFNDYASAIDPFPPGAFDLVVVDGRARPSCLHHALAKVNVGGYLLLDNAERPHYYRAISALDSSQWRCQTFAGPGPRNTYFWSTCVWQKEKCA